MLKLIIIIFEWLESFPQRGSGAYPIIPNHYFNLNPIGLKIKTQQCQGLKNTSNLFTMKKT